MNRAWNCLIGIVLVVLSPLGHFNGSAQTKSEMRAASLLSKQFEAVIYTKSALLASARVLNSDAYAREHKAAEQQLRLLFLLLAGALTAISPNAVDDLKSGYTAVLVGAKDFTRPQGLGIVSSRDCYIAVAKEGIQPNLAPDFRQTQQETIHGKQVWIRSLPPFEGHPTATDFYAANFAGSYFVVTNTRHDFEEAANSLIPADGEGTVKLPNGLPLWNTFSNNKYWAYRVFRRSGVKDPDGAGLGAATLGVHALAFFADVDTKESMIQVFSSAKNTPQLLPSMTQRLQHSEAGVWQAKLPLSNDEAASTALLEIFYRFGFGLVL